MQKKTFGIIGCGNMGSAIVKALVKSIDYNLISVCNRTSAKAELLSNNYHVNLANDIYIAENCDYIFLSVKPQQIAAVFDKINPSLKKRKTPVILVTMLAGMSIQGIRQLSDNYPVIRIMPNTPVEIGEGLTLYCSENVNNEDLAYFCDSLKASGQLYPIEEKLIDAGSAISGCGPAFVYMFLEALADGGVKCGLPRKDAMALASQTLVGAAKLQQETQKHPGALKDDVCSPGGTTIAGVMTLENDAFRAKTANAVIAAYNRTLELKK